MRIDDQYVISVNEDCGVGVNQRLRAGTGEEDAGGYVFDIEELRVRSRCHGTEPSCAIMAELQQSGAGKRAFHKLSEKVAARVAVRMRMRVVMRMVVIVHFGPSVS